VAALARHVVLKAPDKADFRSLAAAAAVVLVAELPTAHQHAFMVFTARLSRASKARPTCARSCAASTCADSQTWPKLYASDGLELSALLGIYFGAF
jgi:hypothetical protein